MMILALGPEWLAVGAPRRVLPGAAGGTEDRLSVLSRYSTPQGSCTVAWHPEQSSIGVATFEGDPRHAVTLLERKLRAQGEIASDVKILTLASQQVGRGYQVLYVTVALDEWQQMLSWAGAQQHICRLTLAAAQAFKRVQAGRAVVLQAGRHFHFFARHDGQLVHLQAVSVDDNVADLEAVAAMLGSQAREEMAARGSAQFEVLWLPAAFKGQATHLKALSSAFAREAQAAVELESDTLGVLDGSGMEVHSGLPGMIRHVRPKDLLNEGDDKLHVLAREYLPYGAMVALAATLGLGYVGFGWTSHAAALRLQAQQLQADEASVRQSISVIARDTAIEKPVVNRQIDTLHLLRKVQGEHDPVTAISMVSDFDKELTTSLTASMSMRIEDEEASCRKRPSMSPNAWTGWRRSWLTIASRRDLEAWASCRCAICCIRQLRSSRRSLTLRRTSACSRSRSSAML